MALTCLLITAILLLSRFYKPFPPKFADGNPKICQGWLLEPPLYDDEGDAKLFLHMEGCRDGEFLKSETGRIRLTVAKLPGEEMPKFSYGDRVRFQASLKPPKNFKNPGSFNFKRYCWARHIDALGFIANQKWITKIGQVEGHSIRKFIERWRERITLSLEAIDNADVKFVSKALLIGDGSEISENIRDDFRKSGLMHLLVISGLNVGFVAAFVFFLLRYVLSLFPKVAVRINIFKPSALFSIIAVWAYTYIAGAEVSVVRASIMATVILSGIMLDKRQDIFTSLSLAALIILADSPFALYDISFQLSFIAVLAIVLIYPLFAGLFSILQVKQDERNLRAMLRCICQTLAVSVSAFIGVTPLLAYYFHNSSVVGIFANIIAVPWVGFVVTPLGLIVSFIAGISIKIGALSTEFWSWTVIPLIKFASYSAAVGKSFAISYTPPKMAVLMFYHVAIFTALRKYLCHAKIAIYACSAVLIAAVVMRTGIFSPKQLEADFLDVGQGSSAVLRLPDGKVVVIDGGGQRMSDFDIGKFVVAPYLWHEGITKVDYLIATHQHSDHFKGLGYLAEEFKPEAIYWNGVLPEEDEGDSWKEFVERVNKAGVPFRPLKRGDELNGIKFLAPPENILSDWNMNNTSIVSEVSYGGAGLLLTGDIEAEAEHALLTTNGQRQTTVLQVPHHGSSTSSTPEFLSAVRPKYAVIQCGEDNHYGFPTEQTLDRLEKASASVFRTDRDGAVLFKISDKGDIKVKAFIEH